VEPDRSQQWFAFAKFLLGTFTIGIVTLIANHQIQQRELEIKEQESVGHFLVQALTQDVGVRRRFAQYFATVTRSDNLRSRWESYLAVVDREYKDTQAQLSKAEQDVQKAISTIEPENALNTALLDQKVSKVDELRAALAVKPSQDRAIIPRVYFHIRSEEQRAKATQLGAQLSSMLSVTVPGVQRVTSGPDKNELRYFDPANLEEARSLATVLAQESGLAIQPVLINGYVGSTLVRPRHYELWLSKDAYTH
jgi:hypothetical protein